MTEAKRDLRDCATAYDCRDRLPELRTWMSDDALKALTIWTGPRFVGGVSYFDLTNPDRGPFVATGDEEPPKDWTYVCQADVAPDVWSQLVTWRQPVSGEQGESLARQARGTTPER